MGKIVGLILILIGAVTHGMSGSIYDVKAELSMNGKKVSSPRFIVNEGVKASMTQAARDRTTFIEIVATESMAPGSPGILMDFVIGFEAKDGSRTIISQPKILASENQQAMITVKDDKGEEIALSVVAQRRANSVTF